MAFSAASYLLLVEPAYDPELNPWSFFRKLPMKLDCCQRGAGRKRDHVVTWTVVLGPQLGTNYVCFPDLLEPNSFRLKVPSIDSMPSVMA